MSIVPYYDTVVSNIRPALIVLSAAVIAVLLIACANLANLMLSGPKRVTAKLRFVRLSAPAGGGFCSSC